MKVKIAKWGNSLGVRLPKGLTEETGLRDGQVVELTARGRGVDMRPAVALKRYHIKEMIAEMDRLGPRHRPKHVDWGPDIGAEIIDDGGARRDTTKRGGPRVGRSQTVARPGKGRRAARRRADRP
jgi:antitoxin MazE